MAANSAFNQPSNQSQSVVLPTPVFTTILQLARGDGLMKIVKATVKPRKPGRPRIISKELENDVINLYESGYGYRAIARILRGPEYGIDVHFSSVRKVLIRLGKVQKKDTPQ